jgi:hypothetical protein
MSQVLEAKLATGIEPVLRRHGHNPLAGAAGIRLLGWRERWRSDRHRIGRRQCGALHTPGDLYGCEYKGVAGKGIRKVTKTKDEETRGPLKRAAVTRATPTPPRIFVKADSKGVTALTNGVCFR